MTKTIEEFHRLKSIEFLYSMFDGGRSMFDVHTFLPSFKLTAIQSCGWADT
jgi:hypothetical protein